MMNKLTILLVTLASSIAINIYSQTVSLDNTFGQNGRTLIPNTSEISLFDFDNHVKLNEYSKERVIFPNPTKENLYFNNEAAFEIFDIQGKILLKSIVPVKSVNIANLKTGIYFIRIDNNVQKIVKE